MMNHKVTIELPDDVYGRFAEAAQRMGRTPEEYLGAQVRALVSLRIPAASDQKSRRDLLKFAGCVSHSADSGDNEKIDRDLAQEYADTHDEQT